MEKRSREAVHVKSKQLKEHTASSFGYEWSKFDDIFPEYEQNFLDYIAPIDKKFFKEKLVLDAGCGAGRHSHFAAKYGAVVIAFDLGAGAVKSTIKNTKGLPVIVKQADIYNLPLQWSNRFDYVFCIGVLHHLPDPQGGFEKLVRTVKLGGTISIWVYGRRNNNLALYLYEPLRKITTRIPHKILYILSFMGALVFDAMNRIKVPILEHYARFPFQTKWNDVFDMLSAPQARYYNVSDIQEWFTQAGLKDIQVSYRMMDGRASGIKGLGVK